MLGTSSNRLSTLTSDEFELDASPAKSTRSHKHTVVSLAPVLESPTKKRRVKADDTDLDVWDKNDDDIIYSLVLSATSKSRWNSAAYDHYKISLKASGQIPKIPGHLGLIDTDTPGNVFTKPSWNGGLDMELVFSDEFNTPGRTF
ncbi:hypothetical protein DFH29DRAFT_1073595 [Suillus ampliporus]|nr:hypothetical protein DFH29DRAFT_1073595 [Suillus ampliporus]